MHWNDPIKTDKRQETDQRSAYYRVETDQRPAYYSVETDQRPAYYRVETDQRPAYYSVETDQRPAYYRVVQPDLDWWARSHFAGGLVNLWTSIEITSKIACFFFLTHQ